MSGSPAVLCRPDGLHVAESPRLWIVTGRASDYARWLCLIAEDPVAGDDWPAHLRRELSGSTLEAVADPLDSDQPLLPVDPGHRFFAGIAKRDSRVVAGITVTAATGVSEIGGAVQRDHRGQGYGHEMLGAVCRLMHGHFGISRLVAGCDTANLASRRWLAGAGFAPAKGPPTCRLANGRIIRPMWWDKVDPRAGYRCRRRPDPRR